MNKPATPWRLDTSAGRSILVYEGCSVIEGEQAEYLLRLIVADAGAAQPAAEPSYDKKALNVLLNDFAQACEFGTDATPRMKAANAIHNWASAALAAPQPAAGDAICIHGKGFQCVTCWPHPAAPSGGTGSSKEGGEA